jgi:hypothetical protein
MMQMIGLNSHQKIIFLSEMPIFISLSIIIKANSFIPKMFECFLLSFVRKEVFIETVIILEKIIRKVKNIRSKTLMQ